MLRRIGGNAAQLVAALERGDAGRVDLARIGRKAWELGTSEIVAQSVVQLDGDVVVRVDESLLTDDAASLHELHRRALGAALTHWRTLFEFVVQMAVGAAGLLSALWRSRRASIASLRRWLTTRRSAERSPAMSVRELLRGDERKRVVAAFRQLRDELLAGGGHAIETTSADGAVVARTVVQPDGDVLWFVSPDALADGSVLDAHVAAVVGWYERSGELVATLQRYLSKAQELARVVLGLVAAAAGVVVGGALRSPLAALLSFAGFAVVAGAVMLLLRSAIGRRLRRGIGRAG
jgi:hypothetical protein